jgi:hypothetical protein
LKHDGGAFDPILDLAVEPESQKRVETRRCW